MSFSPEPKQTYQCQSKYRPDLILCKILRFQYPRIVETRRGERLSPTRSDKATDLVAPLRVCDAQAIQAGLELVSQQLEWVFINKIRVYMHD